MSIFLLLRQTHPSQLLNALLERDVFIEVRNASRVSKKEIMVGGSLEYSACSNNQVRDWAPYSKFWMTQISFNLKDSWNKKRTILYFGPSNTKEIMKLG